MRASCYDPVIDNDERKLRELSVLLPRATVATAESMIASASEDTAKSSIPEKRISVKKKSTSNCKDTGVVYEERIYRGEHGASTSDQDVHVDNTDSSARGDRLKDLEKSSSSSEVGDGAAASEEYFNTQHAKHKTTTDTLSAATTASASHAAVALPLALRSCWPAFFPSRSGAKKAIRKGLVMVRGPHQQSLIKGKCDTQVHLGDVLLRKIPALAPPRHASRGPSTESILQRAIGGKLVLAHLDPHLAIVVKPHGMPVHKLLASSKNADDSTKNDSASAADNDKTVSLHELLLHCLPQGGETCQCEPLRRPAPLHRLDQPTYGLVLVARTQQAAHYFGRVLQERNQVRKRYRAIVHGHMDHQITGSSNFIRTRVSGKECLTEYTIVQRMEIGIRDGTAIIAKDSAEKEHHSITELTLVDLILHTGRKHQLRKHLASIGNPIVGDAKYGLSDLDDRFYKATTATETLNASSNQSRSSSNNLLLLLAAIEITIPHFTAKQQMVIEDETTKHHEGYQHCAMANDAKTSWNYDEGLLKVSIDMPPSMKTLLKHYCRASNGVHACKK